jgi:hypothetical protein
MKVFATLGPAGTNHELVTQRYIDFHGIADARIELVLSFDDALERLVAGTVDHIVQVSVHPEAAMTVAKYRDRVFVIDVFIAPSRPLAVLTRAHVEKPLSLGLQMATKGYVDTSRWATLIPAISIPTVADGLLAGAFDSGITALDVAERYPGQFRVDEVIGSVDDAWLVFGRVRTCTADILAWRESPAAALLRR